MNGKIALLAIALAAAPSMVAQKTLPDGIKDLATQVSASTTKEQKQRVAVIPFKELDGQSTVFGTYVAEEMLTHLVNSGLKIVERGLLDKLLGEQKLQQTVVIDSDTAKRVGKIAGVDAIVTGSVTDLQSNVGINCRLIDTTTGEVFAAAQTRVTKDDDVKKMLAMVIQPAAPASGGRAPGATPAKAPAELTYTSGWFRMTIDGLRRSGKSLTTMVVFENIGGDGQEFRTSQLWLIDENGDRWKGRSSEGREQMWISLPGGTRRRFQFTFDAESGSNGNTFTLTDGGSTAFLHNLTRLP